jgi:hypothetical protein
MIHQTEITDPIAELTAILRADTEAALASIVHSQALAEHLGFELPEFPHGATIIFGSGKRGPSVSASKGKSKPNLAGWLRRATDDGTLPVPTATLIISKRMVQQGLTNGYIVGAGHPYQATPAGLEYATANFKGRKVTRG